MINDSQINPTAQQSTPGETAIRLQQHTSTVSYHHTSRLSLEQAIASRLPSAKIKKATDAHPDSTDVVEAEGSGASYGLLRIGDISGVLWLPLSLAGFGILYRCYVYCSWENTLCHYCLYLLRLSEYIFVPCSPTRTLPGEVE